MASSEYPLGHVVGNGFERAVDVFWLNVRPPSKRRRAGLTGQVRLLSGLRRGFTPAARARMVHARPSTLGRSISNFALNLAVIMVSLRFLRTNSCPSVRVQVMRCFLFGWLGPVADCCANAGAVVTQRIAAATAVVRRHGRKSVTISPPGSNRMPKPVCGRSWQGPVSHGRA